ncbi:hypothetical protein IJ076_00490 [Candidatus Saccharibacteria bacterium]|nr:hypothetical protein [Candidatus Saccharibacteria bacterium]
MKKTTRNRIIFGLFVAAVGIFIVSVAVIKDVMAVSDLENKVLASELVDCYNSKMLKSPVTTSTFQNYYGGGADSFVKGNSCQETVKDAADSRDISLPNSKSSAADIDTFLTEMGYTGEGGASGECISFTYSGGKGSATVTTQSQKICVELDENGNITSDKAKIEKGNKTQLQISSGKGTITIDCAVGKGGYGGCGDDGKGKFKFNKGDSWDDLKKRILDSVVSNAAQVKRSGATFTLNGYGTEAGAQLNVDDYGIISKKYTLKYDEDAIRKGTLLLTGTEYGTKPIFTKEEQFAISQGYLLNFYNADIQCNWTSDEISYNTTKNGYKQIRYYDGTEFKTCYAKAQKNVSGLVDCFNDDGTMGKKCSFDALTGNMKDPSVTTFPTSATSNTNGSNSGGGAGGTGGISTNPFLPNTPANQAILSTEDMVDCNDLQAIGSMQWVLCPTMNNMEYTASWIDNKTQNWLSVDTELYSGSDIYNVWQNIRNVANVLMILFLIVVVISQLTGYGIDNYGIKKMLPRLIVMAVVINLSYYICQLAIDASNIVGAGLRDMFGAFGNALGKNSVGDASFIGGAVTGLFAAAGGGGSAAIGAGITAATLGAEAAVAVVIAVIVLSVIILIAVMVLFLMLGAREIIVVMCVVLSPLAFAAFILPNTQNLFKKWWDLFKAAIIIFPICGAMSGISYMLRVMAQGSEMEWYAIAVVMVLPYLGFFLIPILLKNALSALGKIGGALTAMGGTIKNGGRAMVQGGMKIAQNTEGFKNAQAETLRRRQSELSDKTIKKLTALKDQRELTKDETRKLARAHETKKRLNREDLASSEILLNKEYGDKSLSQLIGLAEEAGNEKDYDRMNALHNVIYSRYGSGGAKEIADSIAKNKFFKDDGSGFVDDGSKEDMFNAIRSNFMDNTSLAGSVASKASDVYQMMMNGGYYNDGSGEAKRGNIDMHSKYNDMMTQDKDRATQGGSTLKRAFKNGAMDAEIADNMLNSNDPTIRSGILSDTGKANILMAASQAKTEGKTIDWSTVDNDTLAKYAERYKASHPSFGTQQQQANDALIRAADTLERAAGSLATTQAVGGAGREPAPQPSGPTSQQPINPNPLPTQQPQGNRYGAENIQQPIRKVNNSGDNNSGRGFNNGAGI